jgi:hypothetical protein
MRYTPLNLHTVENTSLERELPGSYASVCLNFDYNVILVEFGPRLDLRQCPSFLGKSHATTTSRPKTGEGR